MASTPRTDPRFQDDQSSINAAVFEILPENIPNTIITKAPEERFRLGYWSVIGLVVNRVIGRYSPRNTWQKANQVLQEPVYSIHRLQLCKGREVLE